MEKAGTLIESKCAKSSRYQSQSPRKYLTPLFLGIVQKTWTH